MFCSVVVASCRDPDTLRPTIVALRSQCDALGAELIVARARPGHGSDPVNLFDACGLVELPMQASLPAIRGAGLAAARGEIVLLTEDNCIPRPDWVARMLECFAVDIDVVGGVMGNLHADRSVDAAAYFIEYGRFGPLARPPVGSVHARDLTGANVAYRRHVVGMAAAHASDGEWEGAIHQRLEADGARFALARNAVVDQALHYRFGAFCRDRFRHGLAYGRAASRSLRPIHRLMRLVASPGLPVLFAWRAWIHAGRTDAARFVIALPGALLFGSAWAVGEALGYLGRRAA